MSNETDNLALWKAVQTTNPADTKPVKQRGGFTSICAQSQLRAATEQFGPIGTGWGYDVVKTELLGTFIMVSVLIWYGSRENHFGPVLGCAEMLGNRPDSDAPKKATTDAITKGLSQLGFNADIFLGLYDDNKYVEEVTAEFADKGKVNMLASDYFALPADQKQAAWDTLNEHSQKIILGTQA